MLTTHYLGLTLRSPLVVGACAPLSEDLSHLRQLEDAGASAIVLHSLFEEQIQTDRLALNYYLNQGTESYAEALTYFPQQSLFHVSAEAYLDHVRQAKAMVDIPIMASLNGDSPGGWTSYAQLIEAAGADALELNLYAVPTDPNQTAAQLEAAYLDIVRSVTEAVTIPVAVKLSPYFTNLANFAQRLSQTGVDGLVLFNRFYQPDLDIDALEAYPHVLLSTPQDLRLPLRWIAILYGTVPMDFAATGGVHQAQDALKLLMAGANVTMMVSALLRHGIDHLRTVEQDMRTWLQDNEYESIQQLQGSMSQINCPDPSAYERAQYIKSIQTYRPISGQTHQPSRYFG
ncbi:dihydroorotate dehydrogenase-like protein [Nodosilinea sp. LEGE 07088]|uniref:dihydroorotate dehydrogenase-like protein n=1 Tax=Nodosilinea sp. LEGE 07088 TaxID=2777968 RepID=UPI00188034D9|nr:dihydroorotate dehydrogenase-like protein [Nodosilinea sp. LEGE 07088]MBE9137053.1 dihydroorotate dehydrogenase-like protein [Nodosilinea sp. LEGE 07088]